MKNLKIDLFKIAFTIILVGFFIVFCQYLSVFKEYTETQQNGRFLLSNEGYMIIDTRSGAVYEWDGENSVNVLNKPIIKSDSLEN